MRELSSGRLDIELDCEVRLYEICTILHDVQVAMFNFCSAVGTNIDSTTGIPHANCGIIRRTRSSARTYILHIYTLRFINCASVSARKLL